MKKQALLGLLAPLFFFACKKSGGSSGGSGNQQQYYLSSVRNVSPGTQGIDSFSYTSDHLLTRYAQYVYDSSGGTPTLDSLTADFTYNSGSQLPSSYILSSSIGVDEQHELDYDGQSRLIRDSSFQGYYFVVTHYSYSGSNLVANVIYSSGLPLNNELDTLFVNNGNVVSEAFYYPNSAGTADTTSGGARFTYSSLLNPAYHAQIAGPLGHLLFVLSFNGFENSVDFNSKYLVSSIVAVAPATGNISYTYQTDHLGRVVKATSPVAGPSYYLSYLYY